MVETRIGMLGCGSIAEIAHLPAIAGRPDVRLAAICDADPTHAETMAKTWKADAWFSDYREMFDRASLDAVIIATPNNVHRNHGVAAALAGVHVLIEKPLAVTVEEAWDIVNTCHKNGVKLMVGCDRRFWVHNRWAKDLIEQDVVGKIVMSRACLHEHWFNYQNHVARTSFRLDAAVAGGAALNDTGAHAIDLLTWLNGSKVRRAVGVAKRLVMPESYTLCDDTALMMLEFENGAFGTVSCNRFSHAVNQVTELCGTEGTIFTATDATNPFQSWPMAVFTNRDFPAGRLPKVLDDYRWPELFWVEDIVDGSPRKRWVPICPPRHPSNYEIMIEHFLDCIANDKEPLVSGEDGARAVEVMCAVLSSMETGGWVDLPLTKEVIPPHYRPLPREV